MSTAGFPATMEKAGTSLVTTAPAATTPPSPTVTPRKTIAPAPIQASSPDPDRALVERDFARMAAGEDFPDLPVPCRRSQRMGKAVKNIRIMRDQDAISNDDGGGRPDPGPLADVAPFADLDLAAMGEREKLSQDAAVSANNDLVGIATGVLDPCTGAEHGIMLEPTGRASNQPLDQVIDVHAINSRHAAMAMTWRFTP